MLSRFLSQLFIAGPLLIWVASFGGCSSKGGPSPVDRVGGSTNVQSSTGRSAVGGTTGSGFGGGASGGSGGSSASAGSGGSIAGDSGSTTRPGGNTGSGGASGRDAGSYKDGSATKDTALVSSSEDARPLDAGPVKCDDITSNSRLGVWYYTGSGGATTQDIQIHLDVLNFTALSARLAQVTVRYWFTDENPAEPNVIALYYVPTSIGKLNAKFIPLNPLRTNANTVLEFSFTAAPDAGVSFVETTDFNFSFHKDGYSGTFNQANDYSFNSALTKTLGANPKITAYINGVLAWGCEPPPAPPTAVEDAGAVIDGDQVEAL